MKAVVVVTSRDPLEDALTATPTLSTDYIFYMIY
jgi:hypothetical protein